MIQAAMSRRGRGHSATRGKVTVLNNIYMRAQKTPDRTAIAYNSNPVSYRDFSRMTGAARRHLATGQLPDSGVAMLAIESRLHFWSVGMALHSLGLSTVALSSLRKIGQLRLPDIQCVVTTDAETRPDLTAFCAAAGWRLLVVPVAALRDGAAPTPPQPPARAGSHILLTSGISLITTCKGRLGHLKQSLPGFVRAGAREVIVVDYDCPERCGDYVSANFPDVKLARLANKPYWNMAEARNSGARIAHGEYLFFVDADIILADNFLGDLAILADEAALLAFTGRDEFGGSCIVRAKTFNEVGGYDEAISGYGFEDKDLYDAVGQLSSNVCAIDFPGITAISHSHELRNAYYKEQNIYFSWLVNFLYSKMKFLVFNHPAEQLDLAFRKGLHEQVEAGFRDALKHEQRIVRIDFRGGEFTHPISESWYQGLEQTGFFRDFGSATE
jgi:hypothetical protein